MREDDHSDVNGVPDVTYAEMTMSLPEPVHLLTILPVGRQSPISSHASEGFTCPILPQLLL